MSVGAISASLFLVDHYRANPFACRGNRTSKERCAVDTIINFKAFINVIKKLHFARLTRFKIMRIT